MSAYAECRHELDRLGYGEVLPPAALPLVTHLLRDLTALTHLLSSSRVVSILLLTFINNFHTEWDHIKQCEVVAIEIFFELMKLFCRISFFCCVTRMLSVC